jgi:hypothetical protein
MSGVQACELPQGALLRKYLRSGTYADCYFAEIARPVAHAEYVAAFYTTAVFKVERLLLAWLVARPSTDAQADQLAGGTLDSFAAWRVEDRGADQLLMSDLGGRTRSWLMVAEVGSAAGSGTRLYFGSAVVPVVDAKSGQPTLGFAFRALLGFHKLYSRVLLRAARARLARSSARP